MLVSDTATLHTGVNYKTHDGTRKGSASSTDKMLHHAWLGSCVKTLFRGALQARKQ